MPEYELAKNKKIVKMFRKDNTLLIYIILVAIFIGIIFASFFAFYKNQINSKTIQGGVFIKGINVSGLTKEEALKLLESEIDTKLDDHIILNYRNYDYYLEPEQIEAQFNLQDSVDFAYNIARGDSIIQNVKDYIAVLMTHINIDPNFTYNEEELQRYLENIEAKLPDQLEQSSYYLEDDDELVITSGSIGAGIYMDELKNEIVSSLKTADHINRYIEIPTYEKYPNPIDLQAIHEDIYVEAQNAYFTTDPYMVYPHVVGVDFDVEDVQRHIEENPGYSEYDIKLTLTTPEVVTDDIGMEAFPHILASYSTEYVNNANRTTNLRLASNKINNKVVMPGETFSFNKVVGKRTESAGYKNAAIFQDGQVTDGLAGGICQISSTLYNAALLSDMTIVSRRNHMFVPSYVTGGRDATVVWGSTDFKFRNDRDYPIKIESSVSDGIARVAIYGFKNENEYDISIETQKVKTIKFETVKQRKSGYSSGEVIQGGVNGSVWDSWRVYKLNGEVVKREKLARDTYDPQNKIIAR